MKDNKIIKLLSAFSIEEMKEFEKFVASPYFSRGRDLLPVFKVLKTYYPDFSAEELKPENVFRKLYPGKKFDEKSSLNLINTLTSELYKVGKKFLIQTGLEESDTAKNYFLLNNLRKKKLFGEFEKELQKTEEYKKTITGSATISYVKKYLLYYPSIEYAIGKSDFSLAFEKLSSQSDDLIIAAFLSSVNIIEQKYVAGNTYNAKVNPLIANFLFDNLNLEKFIQDINDRSDKYFPFVNVWYLMYQMNNNPDNDEYFFDLKSILYDNIDKFSQKEKFMLFGKLESYCYSKLNGKESEKFEKIEFELNAKQLELGCHKSDKNEPLHVVLFRNILLSAIDCKEFEWLESFIEKYVKELRKDQQDNFRYYSIALLEFARMNFETSLESISKVKYSFFSFKIEVKELMFKLYYELEYFENALSVLNTMKQYIKNTKDLSEAFKLRYKNFIKFSTELLSIKLSNSDKDLGHLKNILKNEPQLISRGWFLKKINSFE